MERDEEACLLLVRLNYGKYITLQFKFNKKDFIRNREKYSFQNFLRNQKETGEYDELKKDYLETKVNLF